MVGRRCARRHGTRRARSRRARPSCRSPSDRGTSRRGAPGRARHHLAARVRGTVRRAARARRRHRLEVASRCRRHDVHRKDGRRLRLGAGQGESRRGVGRRPRGRPRSELRLQRQLLRCAVAGAGRASGRRQSRRAAAGHGHRPGLARAPLRQGRRRFQDRRRGAPGVDPPVHAAGHRHPERPCRDRRHREHPRRPARRSWCSTTAPTSTRPS